MRKYKQTEFPKAHNLKCEANLANPDELSAYIDKELPTWKRHLVRQHLKKCPICASHLQRLIHTDNFLRHAGDVEASDDFLTGVMARVSEVAQHQRQQESLWTRIRQVIEISLGWMPNLSALTGKLRYNIRTRSPVYISILTFAVFTMVGVTLYQPSGDKFGEELRELNSEKVISLEVIQHEPPKRLLTTYLHRK